jgi:prepilin-type N-terminal cleavage/methylation domain-containing protein
MTAPPNNDGRLEGFTLMEMLVTVTIIGILATIALPRINVSRTEAESAMIGLGTALQAAQREGIARQHDVLVTFDEPAGTVRMIFDANNNGSLDAGERSRAIPLGNQVVFGRAAAPALPFGVALVNFPVGTTGLPTLVFHRNGSANFAGGFYLTSVRAQAGDPNNQSDTRAVGVVRATGRVEWMRYIDNAWRRGF